MCLFISTYIMCIGTLYKHITTSHHPRSKAHALQRRIARGKGQATRETSLARHSTEALRHDNSMADGPGWSSTSCGPGCSSHMVFFHNLNRNPSPKGKSPMLRWRYVMGIWWDIYIYYICDQQCDIGSVSKSCWGRGGQDFSGVGGRELWFVSIKKTMGRMLSTIWGVGVLRKPSGKSTDKSWGSSR